MECGFCVLRTSVTSLSSLFFRMLHVVAILYRDFSVAGPKAVEAYELREAH